MAEEKDKNLDIEQDDMYNSDDLEVLDEAMEGNFEAKLKKMREKLKVCEKEKQEYLDGWQRSRAESLNSKKAHAEALEAVKARSEREFVEKLLPILDSFDLAFGNIPENIDTSHDWVRGVTNIQSQFVSILESCGVAQINPEGETFDPHKHESIGVLDIEDEGKDNTVAEVFQKGYEHDGMIIRPAKVRVAQYKIST